MNVRPRPFRILRWLAALFRVSKRLVCEESRDMGLSDLHDFPDSIEGEPWHMVVLTCKRCGKKFVV